MKQLRAQSQRLENGENKSVGHPLSPAPVSSYHLCPLCTFTPGSGGSPEPPDVWDRTGQDTQIISQLLENPSFLGAADLGLAWAMLKLTPGFALRVTPGGAQGVPRVEPELAVFIGQAFPHCTLSIPPPPNIFVQVQNLQHCELIMRSEPVMAIKVSKVGLSFADHWAGI